MFFSRSRTQLVAPERALRGRDHYPFTVPTAHRVLHSGGASHPLQPPFPDGIEQAVFGLGCFWGAEEIFWQLPGVWTTAVGYTGGSTAHPEYEEVCSGRTGHTEAVLVGFDPDRVAYAELLATFFEVHDPTQGMRQGNDVGTQYRSGIYYRDEGQRELAERAVALFGDELASRRYGRITTEVRPLDTFYFAEPYHQQYLAKNPHGYRCHSTTGLTFPRDRLRAAA